MMKAIGKILILFPLYFIVNLMYAQMPGGKIKSYRDSYFSIHEVYGKIKKGPKLNDSSFRDQYVTFDQKGNVVQLIEYFPDGTIYCKCDGKTDYKNNKFESLYVRFFPEIQIDKKQFILASVKYPSGEMCEMNYKNDINGRPVEEAIFDLMGRVIFKITIKRDDLGRSVEYDLSNGTVYQYKYNSNGNVAEWISRPAAGNTISTSYAYDSSGNVTETIIRDYFKMSYKYLVERNTFKYKYDKKGNWVERVDYEGDIPKRVVVRTIEY